MAKKYNEYYLNWDEISSIVAAAKNLKESVILKILSRTGMRRFELANIKIKDIDFGRKRIFIEKGKGAAGELRFLPEWEWCGKPEYRATLLGTYQKPGGV